MVFDRDNSCVGQRRSHLPNRQVTIEGEEGAARKTQTKLDDRGRFLPIHAVNREVTIRATNQAEWWIGASRLKVARSVASEASKR